MYKPITIEKQDPNTENWSPVYNLHAKINKTKQTEFLGGGASRSSRSLTFEVRYFSGLKEIAYNTQGFRVIYQGHAFNIVDYDDYKEQHRTVRLSGESYQ